MARTGPQRIVAVLVSAALLSSLAVTTAVAPASAAKPKCQGKTATIVGTARGEVIRGTAKRDVIVARGGHDTIYGRGGDDIICGNRGNDRIVGGGGSDQLFGQAGRDKLLGGPGSDRLVGGPAIDLIDGGIGRDACFQGAGSGARVNCERPTPRVAIAYSDMNGNHAFDAGDVLVARLADTNGDRRVSPGDTITMGRYPTKQNPGPADFADWGVASHVVSTVTRATSDTVRVTTTAGGQHEWRLRGAPHLDVYEESLVGDIAAYSGFADKPDTAPKLSIVFDELSTHPDSPSRPITVIEFTQTEGTGDDRFLDVEILP